MKNIATELAAEIKGWLDTQEVKDVFAATEKAEDSKSGSFEVVITTENLDRYNEVIKIDGWELEHYRKNPVVLWGHDHKQLIGMATSVEIADGKMIAKGKFAPNALGQEVRALYEAGFLRATSVGFIEKEREGNLITKAELLEFSFVSVPANPYALSLAMEKELNLNELVTKGFMNIKEAEPVTVPEKNGEDETPAPVVAQAPKDEAKTFNTKAITPIIDSLKGIVIALEALSVEPEREEVPTAEEDKKAFADFEQKKIVQEAATVIGEVLAEWRQREEAKV